MTAQLRNLDWLRTAKPTDEGYSARLFEALSDVKSGLGTLEQQGNFNLQGTPAAPPTPDALKVVSHPQGVQFSISHNADFYKGIGYKIDATSDSGVTHTYDVGSSRNGVLPVGNLKASYQVRATYPNGLSTPAVRHNKTVVGGGGTSDLLPSQGAGTTRAGQPPGFGGAYRGSKPPARGAQ